MKTGWIEIAVARWLGKTFPWLLKVERLPGGGSLTQCGFWHSVPANEDQSG